MGRMKATQQPNTPGKPQGEQQLSTDAWAAIVKAIRELAVPTALISESTRS